MRNDLPATLDRLLGSPPASRQAVEAGYTRNERWIVGLEDGRSVFVKAAVDDMTAGWLRDEHALYAALDASFLPPLLAWADEPLPVLVLADLSRWHWPPPWRPGDVETVLATLEKVAATPPPPGAASLESRRAELSGWPEVERDPKPFLGARLCSAVWLERALPVLRAAEEACVLDGDALLHFDVRSDNVCLHERRAVLVDWNWAVRGNATMDVAAWLPSLESEGGPAPETILPGERGPAALVAGFFAARVGLPAPSPRVAQIRLTQLRSALPWAAHELGLPPPDGS